MHWTLPVIALLAAWALIGGVWRPASFALAGEWMAGQLWWLATGDSVPLALYAVCDPLVMLALWRWGSASLDVWIIALFPVEWWFYATADGAAQWWALWSLTCIQLTLAGPWPQVQRAIWNVTHGPSRGRGLL